MTDTPTPIKVDKWDGNAVKNALDDATKKILKDTYGFVESFRLVDGRLALCTAAIAFALFAVLWDWLHPFPKSQTVLIVCVAAYFVLTCVLTLYLMMIEKNRLFIGLEKDKAGIDPDNQWIVSTTMKRYSDMYHIEITFVDGITKEQRSRELQKSVANFFDENGTLSEVAYSKEIAKMVDSLEKEKKTQ